ncbi:hypothetical protein [Mucilaginibacter segetis]|uniref:Uncharacterized protein n=1 Tax=Mucilaginibacter segetis TaxID=2793071 RepID=A0A934PTL5_9SPHI|nr:hypothetical protein [Mucilaginibacter segetis]MBK0378830.1 hypothetical protein [Mucilaginibacter segetis]
MRKKKRKRSNELPIQAFVKRVTIYLTAILIVCVVIYATRYLVYKKQLKDIKLVSYVYKHPIIQVREEVVRMFSDERYHGLDMTQGYNSSESDLLKISQSDNLNHFFINWFAWYSGGESELYYNWWGKLKYIPKYHIVLDSISNDQTKIEIQSFPKVEAGTQFSLNHGLPYVTSRKVEVKPTTIEEYEIIKRIGKALGEKMPE